MITLAFHDCLLVYFPKLLKQYLSKLRAFWAEVEIYLNFFVFCFFLGGGGTSERGAERERIPQGAERKRERKVGLVFT